MPCLVDTPTFVREINDRAKGLCELLIQWANQNSGSENIAGLAAMENLLANAFSELGIVERISLGRTAARAVRVRLRPNAPKQILFSGHYDTVYGADHPFQSCSSIDDRTLRGPGVADMKGGLVVMLAALSAFQKSPAANQIGGEILLTPDEEIGSTSSRSLLEESAKRHDFGLVFEPCRENGDLVRARMATGIFTATCRGRSAHAGRAPLEGRNAIVALAEFLPKVDALNREMPTILLNVGRIIGGSAANIVPDFAQAELNLRVSTRQDGARLLARLEELAAPVRGREGFSLVVEGQFNRAPKEVTAADEALFSAWQNCGEQLGLKFGWQDVGGGSDGNILAAAGLPNLDGLGAMGGQLHSPSEYVKPESLVSRAQVAALFLHRLASGEISLPKRTR